MLFNVPTTCDKIYLLLKEKHKMAAELAFWTTHISTTKRKKILPVAKITHKKDVINVFTLAVAVNCEYPVIQIRIWIKFSSAELFVDLLFLCD